MNLERIERGWAGHFCCGKDCQWRRNTLVIDKDTGKGIVISSVGQLLNYFDKRQYIEIGARRYYETMVFVAKEKGGYIEADVGKQIFSPDGMQWYVSEYPKGKTDLKAEKIHEGHVDYVIKNFEKLINEKEN